MWSWIILAVLLDALLRSPKLTARLLPYPFLIQTVLVIKYVLPPYPGSFGVEWGVANVIQSSTCRSPSLVGNAELTSAPSFAVTIMLSAIVLWVAQSSESDYEYNLTL
jgi:hypothetical protein